MTYATVAELREWAHVDQVPDSILQACLDEAEVGLRSDLPVDPAADPIPSDPDALHVAHGETLRRAQRLLSRRNSPEGVLGVGGDFGGVRVPVRDPDSQRAVLQLRRLLGLPAVAMG